MDIETKVCTSCQQAKPRTDFGIRKASLDGLAPICRTCKKAKDSQYYRDHAEAVKAKCKVWTTSEAGRAYHRTYSSQTSEENQQAKEERRRQREAGRDAAIHEAQEAAKQRHEQGHEIKAQRSQETLEQRQARQAQKANARDARRLQVLALRQQGLTREAIAAQTGYTLAGVKSILLEAGVALPMEQRQANAYQAKLARDPDAMAHMREGLTPEVMARRDAAIRDRYNHDADLRALKGEQSRTWWESLSEAEKSGLPQFRRGEESTRVQSILSQEGFPSMTARYQALAEKLGGKLVDEYRSSHEFCTWTCQKGHSFQMQPYVVTNGHWCPQCAHVGPSQAQLELVDYVRSLGETVVVGDRQVIGPKELDIWVPEKKFALEYNGLLHHSDYFENNRGRHLAKARACREAGVRLLAVFEDEWRDRPELIRAMIRWRLGRFSGQTHRASDLEVRDVPRDAQQAFLTRNHLDGYAVAVQALGLWAGEQLIQCLSLRHNWADEQEIARQATDYDHRVQGGFTKLLRAARERLGAVDLVSYSNNRLGWGDSYRQAGFDLVAEQDSSYWYTDSRVRHWRFRCRRINDAEVLARYPHVEHTETAQARAGVISLERLCLGEPRPLYRIEDYGHRKWVLRGDASGSTAS